MTRPITLVVSIDTEEDNWAPARTGITVDNIRELPRLHRVLGRLGVRPTYFVTYQVALRPWAADILRGISADGNGEIGAHLHPWNTPPLTDELVPRNTMLLNLPAPLQAVKIASLTNALQAATGERPRSFRAGRWGFGASTAAALLKCGYRVDSSVTPFESWARYDDGPSHVGAPLDVYRLDGLGDPRVPVPEGALVEVPVTCGYSRGPIHSWARLHGLLNSPVARGLRLGAMASRAGVIRHIVLTPEVEPVENMLTLSRHLIGQGVRHLHVSLHSPSLRPGLTPFASTRADVDRLYRALDTYVDRLSAFASLQCATVAEAAERLAKPATAGEPPARRLVVISYHHPPDSSIGGMRWAGLTKYLRPLGWRSWIVTAAASPPPTNGAGTVIVSCPPRTTLNDLYRRFRLRNTVVGAASAGESLDTPVSNGGVLARLRLDAAMALSLPDEGRGWVLRAAIRTRRLIAQLRPDAVVSSGPPHSAHLVAWLATRGLRTRWVADLRDPWAGPVTAAWRASVLYRSGLSRWVITWLERLVLRSASGALCNTREFADALAARYPGVRVGWVPNGVDRELLPAPAIERFAGLAMAYVGTVYGGRDLRVVLHALRDFLDRHPSAADASPLFRLAGSIDREGRREFEREVSALGLDGKVEYLGILSRVGALEVLARSRLAVVLAQGQEYQVPAKLYELVGMGIPTLVIAPSGSASSSEAERLGAATIAPGDVRALVGQMEDVWQRQGEGSGARCPDAALDYQQLAPSVSALLSRDSGWLGPARPVEECVVDLPHSIR